MSDTTGQRTPTPRPRGLDGPDDADPARQLWSLWRQGQKPRVEDFLERAGVRDPEEIAMALQVDQAERCRLGQWVPAEDYLDAFPAVRDHAAAAVDLIFAEFLLREGHGERPPLEEFLRRFPQHAEELGLQIQLHRELADDRTPTATRDGTVATPVADDSAAAGAPTADPEIPGEAILGVLGRRGMEIVRRDRLGERNRELDLSQTLEARADGPGAAADGVPRLGRYRIEHELGRGGMGVVFRAFDEKRGIAVALKTLAHADAAAILRFKQEFRTLADVSHPNLVALHELATDGPIWFFTMELIDGVDFLRFVRSGTDRPGPVVAMTGDLGPPSPSLPGAAGSTTDAVGESEPPDPKPFGAVSGVRPAGGYSIAPAALARLRIALRQLAEGVIFLHEAGKLHRDLKPSNVLVTGRGRVVILDFGLAADVGASGLHQSLVPYVLGTSAYMAPEQAARRPVSPASDWYSLGSMLYQALTGHTPFQGPPGEVLRDKQRFEPPAPRELVPGVPDDLNALCVDLLRRCPEARPSGRDVLRRLGSLTGEPGPAPASQASGHQLAPFVSRARDLESLEAAFADVDRGRTVAVYIHGPSGVGKTALVRRFLDDLSGRERAIVLAGRCYEQESVPYKALDNVVDGLSQYLHRLPLWVAEPLLPRDIRSLVRVFPVLREAEAMATAPRFAGGVADPQELRRRAFRALRELLARLGDRRPLVLAIDDLQWGDSDSAVLLSELLHPPEAPRLLLLGCYRSDDAATSPLLQALLQAQEGGGPGVDSRVLALGPLEPGEAEALALTHLGSRDQAARAHAAAIARESGGNPFFITELVRYVQADTGLLHRVPGADEVAFDEVLWARVRRLPEEARRLLEVVAVSGRPLGQADASRAAELDAGEQKTPSLLRSGRLIRSTGPAERGEIETYHDRVREAVVAHLPPIILEGHHRRLARVLESSGRADAEVLAVHCRGAGERERAGMYYAQAAMQAGEALAFDRAARLYRLALELRPGDDAEGCRLRIALADALANAGRGPEAAREYLAAAAGATVAETFELQRRAAMQFLITGHIDEGLAQLGAVLKEVGMALPGTPGRAIMSLILNRIRLRLRGLHFRPRDPSEVSAEDLTRLEVSWTAAGGLGIIDPIRSAAFQARNLLLALQVGDPYRIGRALALEASHLSSAGGRSQRRVSRLVRMIEAIAQRLDSPYIWGGVFIARGIAAYMSGQWKRGGELCDRAADVLRTRCTGVTFELNSSALFSLWSLQFRGEIAELGRRWPLVLKEALERGDRHMVTNLNTLLMSTLRLAADDPEGAETTLRMALGQWTRQGFHIQHNEGFGAEVQIRLYRRDGVGAWNFMETRYVPSLARSHLTRIQKIRTFLYERRARAALAAAAGATGAGPLLRAAERDARRLDREGMAWSRALAYPIRAGIAAARGDRSRAASLFAEAVIQLEAVDMNLYAAASRRRLGEILGGDEGRAQVERADSWMRQQTIRNPARMADVFAPVVP
jgi:serine/threonine protein kinase